MDDQFESPLERLRRLSEGGQPSRAPRRASGSPKGPIAGVLAVLVLLLVKFGKVILLFLGKLKFLLVGLQAIKFQALFATVGTMAASAWVYAHYYGWPLAVGLVVLILAHELGHGAAARLAGLEVGAPIFIPFFGAVITSRGQRRSTCVDAGISIAGPLVGMLGGLACLGAAALVEDPHWKGLLVVLAWLTFMLNLFNLTPAMGLDGQGASRPLRASHWLWGTIALAVVFVWSAGEGGRPNIVLLIIGVLGIVRGVGAWRSERGGAAGGRLVDRLSERQASYTAEEEVTPGQRRTAALAYFGLVIGLSRLYVWAHGWLPPA